ncbi:type VI secretion system baseplate subunit TssF [Ochrobactrum sp. GPK 3]|uniref:type VI secretion system baseplate subunit TssF n=1 Tax=Brucella sp. 22210 TaxID=3453892 RepID=UPI0031385891
MNDRFLVRYNEELAALRRKAAMFAKKFPKIAGRLRLTADVADDPHVEHMIQSFAFSAARIRQKLDDEFPELTSSLLGTLYPHFLAPLPAMSVVRFEPNEQLSSAQIIPRFTEVISEAVGGESCRFRTTQNIELVPIRMVSAKLTGQPIEGPISPVAGALSCLHLTMRPLNMEYSLKTVGLNRLRIHLSAPWRKASILFELLANQVLGIGVARHKGDSAAPLIIGENLRIVGHSEEEAMLPYPATSFSGYRLLSEFFALPQKFLFFDINNIQVFDDKQLDVFIYFKTLDNSLIGSVTETDFVLNATPIVNLFQQACEPLLIDGTKTEYQLVPDARRYNSREIYSVQRVQLSDRNARDHRCEPFFKNNHGDEHIPYYWQASRRQNDDDLTTDVDIAFIDGNGRPLETAEMVASVDALCTNRTLSNKLPFGGGHPYFSAATKIDNIASIIALTPPTAASRRPTRDMREWQLISHLLLNHRSLSDNDGSALKDILSLYLVNDSPETRHFIDAITRVDAQKATKRLNSDGIIRGTDIVIEFEPDKIEYASAYVLGSILDHFLSLYTSINSFTRLTIKMRGRPEATASWPARASTRPLV